MSCGNNHLSSYRTVEFNYNKKIVLNEETYMLTKGLGDKELIPQYKVIRFQWAYEFRCSFKLVSSNKKQNKHHPCKYSIWLISFSWLLGILLQATCVFIKISFVFLMCWWKSLWMSFNRFISLLTHIFPVFCQRLINTQFHTVI